MKNAKRSISPHHKSAHWSARICLKRPSPVRYFRITNVFLSTLRQNISRQKTWETSLYPKVRYCWKTSPTSISALKKKNPIRGWMGKKLSPVLFPNLRWSISSIFHSGYGKKSPSWMKNWLPKEFLSKSIRTQPKRWVKTSTPSSIWVWPERFWLFSFSTCFCETSRSSLSLPWQSPFRYSLLFISFTFSVSVSIHWL